MRLVTRAELAKIKGVSRPAVTQALKGQLAAALHEDKVDLDHPDVQRWVRAPKGKGGRTVEYPQVGLPPVQQSTVCPPAPAPAAPAPRPPTPEAGFDPAVLDYTVAQVAERFGTLREYKDYLEAGRILEQCRKLRLSNDQLEGSLVKRELVANHVFGFLEATQKRMLVDAPQIFASRIASLAKAGASREEIEAAVRTEIGKHLDPVKRKVTRALRTTQ